MRLVVSDSGPLHYLLLCGVIEVLPNLYDRLVIPTAVVQELTHPNTPAVVSRWIQTLPQWASAQTPGKAYASPRLGHGEREAIVLAAELKATHLLVDDRVARRFAIQQGLATSSTIGVMEHAATLGLLNLQDTMKALLDTNFRIDPEVVREVLAREATRISGSKEKQ